MCSHGQFLRAFIAWCPLFVTIASDGLAQDPLENAPLAPESARTAARTPRRASTGSTNKADAEGQDEVGNRRQARCDSQVAWRMAQLLTRMQYAVTREKMTEQPFAGKYASGHFRGTFVCVCCDAAHVQSELFSSQTKFDSGTGWPSFYQAFSNKSLQSAWDYSEGEPRLEVTCRRCGSASRPCFRRWSASHRPAFLHQLGGDQASFVPNGTAVPKTRSERRRRRRNRTTENPGPTRARRQRRLGPMSRPNRDRPRRHGAQANRPKVPIRQPAPRQTRRGLSRRGLPPDRDAKKERARSWLARPPRRRQRSSAGKARLRAVKRSAFRVKGIDSPRLPVLKSARFQRRVSPGARAF